MTSEALRCPEVGVRAAAEARGVRSLVRPAAPHDCGAVQASPSRTGATDGRAKKYSTMSRLGVSAGSSCRSLFALFNHQGLGGPQLPTVVRVIEVSRPEVSRFDDALKARCAGVEEQRLRRSVVRRVFEKIALRLDFERVLVRRHWVESRWRSNDHAFGGAQAPSRCNAVIRLHAPSLGTPGRTQSTHHSVPEKIVIWASALDGGHPRRSSP